MAFTPRTWVVGEVVTAAQMNTEIRDQFNNRFPSAYKSADTIRSTATLADDPHLTLTVEANARYIMDALLHVDTSDATNADLNLDWSIPSGATGRWQGLGQPTSATGTDGTVRTVSSAIDAARNFGATVDSANPLAIRCSGHLVTTNAGTYACSWARTGGSGSLTMLAHSWVMLQRTA